MRRVTFCVESDESRSLCVQSVTFCTKCSAVCCAVRAGRDPVAVPGVAAGGAGVGALPSATVAGQSDACWWYGGRGWGVVAHSFWGAGRGGGVVPTVSRPRGTSGDGMNVQRSPRCTFILVPGLGLIGKSARFCHLLIAVCRKNVQLCRPGQLAACPRSPTGLSLG